MGDDLYRLIPEEGKHLADSRDTEGAYRGVYLDDETNKVSGAGEFVKVDPDELFDSDKNEVTDTENPSKATGIAELVTLGIVIGVAATKAYPHVKKWTLEKAVPSVKHIWNKARGKEDSVSLCTPEKDFVEAESNSTALSVDVAYNGYRENMSSEDAQRELIEAFILYLESMKKVRRVANANLVDSEGMITDGMKLIESMENKGMIESINEILNHNPALLSREQSVFLSEILGYEVDSQKDYIPITAEALSEGLFFKR